MSLRKEMEDAAAEILSQVGEEIEWICAAGGRQTIRAIVSGSTDSANGLDLGGFQADYEFTVKVLQSDFTTAQPAPLDTIKFDDTTYLIQSVQKSRVGPYYILKIGTP